MSVQTARVSDHAADQENDGFAANRIDVLQSHGVNASDVDKLKAAGIHSVEGLQMATKKQVLEVRGITEARYASLISAASTVSDRTAGAFKSAADVKTAFQACKYHVSTGSSELDTLLGGGMESGSLTEIYGEYRTGKTQLCMTMAITAQINSTRPGKVAYIDTEGTFMPKRLEAVAERFQVDFDAALGNILVCRAYNVDQQQEVLAHLEAKLCEEDSMSLVIVDSIMSLWRTDFCGRGELSERQQKLGKYLNALKQIAERHNIAVVYTNVVMSDPSGGMTFVADPKKPAGGHVLAHASNTRVSLRKGRDTERIAKLVDSSHLPEGEARFFISNNGVADSD